MGGFDWDIFYAGIVFLSFTTGLILYALYNPPNRK